MKRWLYIGVGILALISSLWVWTMMFSNLASVVEVGGNLFRMEYFGYYILLLLPIIPIVSFFKENKILFILNISVLVVTIPIILIEVISNMQVQGYA